jgi:NitT/TauT family transport system ATP-binding protein
LVLLDEPFGALDEFSRHHMDDELAAWWRDAGLTIAFVTHSIAEAVYLSTRIVVMAARPGRVIADVPIDAPWPRGNAFRASPAFAAQCVALSELVTCASGGGSIEGPPRDARPLRGRRAQRAAGGSDDA